MPVRGPELAVLHQLIRYKNHEQTFTCPQVRAQTHIIFCMSLYCHAGKASSNRRTWSSDKRQPEAPQFSSIRARLLDLGITMTLGWEMHQFKATWAGVLPTSSATSCNACVRVVREPSASGV